MAIATTVAQQWRDCSITEFCVAADLFGAKLYKRGSLLNAVN
jgi:hypothetical protein